MTIAQQTEMFVGDELQAMAEMLSGYFAEADPQQTWLLAEAQDAGVLAAGLVGPEPFSEDVWNLYFIGTLTAERSKGIGSGLVAAAEDAARNAGARLLLVETSSGAAFARTRKFYPREGFTEEGRIRDYYGEGDDKVIFRKKLYAQMGRRAGRF